MQTTRNANARGRKPSTATRDRILAAARELFADRGFKGTTTAAIARKARVNEALIFRHFPAKSDLYTAILAAKLGDENLTRIIQAAECRQVSADRALRLVAQRFGECVDPEFVRLYYYSALEGHDLANGFYDQFVQRLISLVKELIEQGIKEGVFREVDAGTAALAFTGMLRSYCLTRTLFPGHAIAKDSASVTAAFCDLFLKGLAGR